MLPGYDDDNGYYVPPEEQDPMGGSTPSDAVMPPPHGDDTSYGPGGGNGGSGTLGVEHPMGQIGTNFYPNAFGAYGFAGDRFTPKAINVPDYYYQDFKPPTEAEAMNDEGYKFGVDEMTRALKNEKSAQGILATGGTLDAMMRIRNGLAAQQYGNVFQRGFQTWDANRQNNRDINMQKYGRQVDEFGREKTIYDTNEGTAERAYGLNLDTSRLNLTRDATLADYLKGLYELMNKNKPGAPGATPPPI